MSPRADPRGPGSLILGILRLARFDPRGLAAFEGTRAAFLGSLAPWLAFPAVGCALLLLEGAGLDAVASFAAVLCALLLPPVISHAFAARWGKEAQWLRYATAFNWVQWAVPAVALLLLAALAALTKIGLGGRVATLVDALALVGYGFALHWFLARHALEVSGRRAFLLTLSINVGTALVVLGVPQLLAAATTQPPPKP